MGFPYNERLLLFATQPYKGSPDTRFLAPKVTTQASAKELARELQAAAKAVRFPFVKIIEVRHRSYATYSRQPRQVRKEATVTGSCVCSGSPVPGLFAAVPRVSLCEVWLVQTLASRPYRRQKPHITGTNSGTKLITAAARFPHRLRCRRLRWVRRWAWRASIFWEDGFGRRCSGPAFPRRSSWGGAGSGLIRQSVG
jgi:hypothetical protein